MQNASSARSSATTAHRRTAITSAVVERQDESITESPVEDELVDEDSLATSVEVNACSNASTS